MTRDIGIQGLWDDRAFDGFRVAGGDVAGGANQGEVFLWYTGYCPVGKIDSSAGSGLQTAQAGYRIPWDLRISARSACFFRIIATALALIISGLVHSICNSICKDKFFCLVDFNKDFF